MQVMITGVRSQEDPDKLLQLLHTLPLHVKTVVTSDRTGVDAWAREFAQGYNHKLLEWPTLWQTYGRHACRIRNNALCKAADVAVVFTRKDCFYSQVIVRMAIEHGLPVFTLPLDEL